MLVRGYQRTTEGARGLPDVVVDSAVFPSKLLHH